MHENEDGERELVLGNRQLLAIFFVGALLCGVFFAMGYVVGGNSAKAGAAAASATDSASAVTSDGKREEPRAQSATDGGAMAGAMAASGDMGSQLPAAEPRVADNPAAAGAQPPVPAAPAPAPMAETAPAPRSAAPVSAAAATPVYLSVPEKDASYWQVTATQRPAADDLVRMFRERQLPAILAESSNPRLFRVLVGPYRSPVALADAKRKVTDLGFDGIVIQKY